MPNTATITVPVGTNENFFAGDDADTATADAFMFWELPDGTTIVTCDPTNLKVTKVAKGDFVAAEGGYPQRVRRDRHQYGSRSLRARSRSRSSSALPRTR